jgi:hypothetical protein
MIVFVVMMMMMIVVIMVVMVLHETACILHLPHVGDTVGTVTTCPGFGRESLCRFDECLLAIPLGL